MSWSNPQLEGVNTAETYPQALEGPHRQSSGTVTPENYSLLAGFSSMEAADAYVLAQAEGIKPPIPPKPPLRSLSSAAYYRNRARTSTETPHLHDSGIPSIAQRLSTSSANSTGTQVHHKSATSVNPTETQLRRKSAMTFEDYRRAEMAQREEGGMANLLANEYRLLLPIMEFDEDEVDKTSNGDHDNDRDRDDTSSTSSYDVDEEGLLTTVADFIKKWNDVHRASNASGDTTVEEPYKTSIKEAVNTTKTASGGPKGYEAGQYVTKLSYSEDEKPVEKPKKKKWWKRIFMRK